MTLPKSSPKAAAIFSPSALELVQANILGCKMAFDILLVFLRFPTLDFIEWQIYEFI
jgi:hypothetical protein